MRFAVTSVLISRSGKVGIRNNDFHGTEVHFPGYRVAQPNWNKVGTHISGGNSVVRGTRGKI